MDGFWGENDDDVTEKMIGVATTTASGKER
jgi:hypothetical protein